METLSVDDPRYGRCLEDHPYACVARLLCADHRLESHRASCDEVMPADRLFVGWHRYVRVQSRRTNSTALSMSAAGSRRPCVSVTPMHRGL